MPQSILNIESNVIMEFLADPNAINGMALQ